MNDDKLETELRAKFLKQIEDFQRDYIVPHLMYAARNIKKYAINHLKSFNIGFEQISVMHALALAKELNINQLAKILYKDRGTISRCVESLCAKKYAIKIKSNKDQRVHIVKMTPKDEDFFVEICHYFTNISQKPESVLSKDEAKEFHKSLQKLIDYCDESSKSSS